MNYHIRPMSAADARAICEWRYPGAYKFYDMDADPEDLQEFLDFEGWVPDAKFAVADGGGDLVGFFEFVTRDGVTAVGLGLRPDLTGHGLGQEFLRTGLRFAAERFRPRRFALAVATFNQRAITVYQRMGFSVTQTFVQNTNGGQYEFVQMVADPTSLGL